MDTHSIGSYEITQFTFPAAMLTGLYFLSFIIIVALRIFMARRHRYQFSLDERPSDLNVLDPADDQVPTLLNRQSITYLATYFFFTFLCTYLLLICIVFHPFPLLLTLTLSTL